MGKSPRDWGISTGKFAHGMGNSTDENMRGKI
jgi:hypothetical protein